MTYCYDNNNSFYTGHSRHWKVVFCEALHCKMKRVDFAQKMGPKRVSSMRPHRNEAVFGTNFWAEST